MNVSLDPLMDSSRSLEGMNIKIVVIAINERQSSMRKALSLSMPRRCRARMPGSNKYTMNNATTNGTRRMRIARNARKSASSNTTNARSRKGSSPNRFFISSPDLPDVTQLHCRVTEPFRQRSRKPDADLGAYRGMKIDDLHKIGMEEP